MNSSSAQSVNNQPVTLLLGPPISLRHRDNLSISAATIQTRQRVNGGPSSRLNQHSIHNQGPPLVKIRPPKHTLEPPGHR
jgi:hypothetical protein